MSDLVVKGSCDVEAAPSSCSRKPGRWLRVLLSLRFIPVIILILPMSFWLRQWMRYQEKRRNTKLVGSHAARIAYVQGQLRASVASGLCSARPSRDQMTMRIVEYKKSAGIDLRQLDNVLEINAAGTAVAVEPGCIVLRLTSFLMARGYTLLVTPELDELTIGGLVCGYGIESSSHIHGLFFDTVESCDVVVASGELVHCSRSENSDLFYAMSWAMGSLGFVVRVELRIKKSLPYVRLSYTPLFRKDLIERLALLTTGDNRPEFVEALMFDQNRGVLIEGDYSDNKENLGVNEMSYWSEWFYKIAETELHKHGCDNVRPTKTEVMPLLAYFHRHTKGLFWEMELVLPFGNHWLFRYLLGWLMPVSISLLKLTHNRALQTFYEQSHVAQDFLVPLAHLDEALTKCDNLFEVYPLWLCPHKVEKTTPQGAIRFDASKLPSIEKDGEAPFHMFFDIGVYGVSGVAKRGETWFAPDKVAAFEKYLIEIGGYSALYAIVELSEEDFCKMFDQELYSAMKTKWDPQNRLLDRYQKIRKAK